MFTPDPFSTIALLTPRLEAIGYAVEPLRLGGRRYTRFTAPSGKSWLTEDDHIHYPFVSSSARSVSREKNRAYDLAASAGVTVPATFKVRQQPDDELVSHMLELAPLIVKPISSSLSQGLTMDVRTARQLQTAVEAAQQFSASVLVQQQVSGEEIRFVVMQGRVTAALLRQSPQVVGDGRQTVGQLLSEENRLRSELKLPYITYPQLAPPLIDTEQLDMQRVPAEGEVVKLGMSTMIGGGASVYDSTGDIHPSYLGTAARLAAALGDGLVVVDMIVQDYRQPQRSDNYAFIEFNMSPVIKLFYSCRDGRHYDILTPLAEMIDASINRGGTDR